MARSKVRIVYSAWKFVPDKTKDLIWTQILIYSFFKLQSLSAVNYAPAHRERGLSDRDTTTIEKLKQSKVGAAIADKGRGHDLKIETEGGLESEKRTVPSPLYSLVLTTTDLSSASSSHRRRLHSPTPANWESWTYESLAHLQIEIESSGTSGPDLRTFILPFFSGETQRPIPVVASFVFDFTFTLQSSSIHC
ncbi:hypothetical protein K1719_000998 [Acacia pycnantha]|nr:hypothetical protein K1719_000998 [Acacia pycnantha]